MEKAIAKNSIQKIVSDVKNTKNVSQSEAPKIVEALKTLNKIANIGGKSKK
jgi:hypothetical protein